MWKVFYGFFLGFSRCFLRFSKKIICSPSKRHPALGLSDNWFILHNTHERMFCWVFDWDEHVSGPEQTKEQDNLR